MIAAPTAQRQARAGRFSPTSAPPKPPTSDPQHYSYMLDPVLYAFDSGWVADPWQVDFLQSHQKYRLLNNSRQSGKSTTVSWGVTHRAAFWPNSLILLVSPGERQSYELMRKVQAEVMPVAPYLPGVVGKGTLHVEFDNGSRIIALPGKEGTIRGYSAVDILVIDEAARVPNDLYVAVRPMLAVSGGALWTLSTPYGTRGWWYDICRKVWEAAKEGKRARWEYIEVPATMCPRLDREFLVEEYNSMGEFWFAQEYLCKFMDAESAPFSLAEVERAFVENIMPWDLVAPGDRNEDNGGIEKWEL